MKLKLFLSCMFSSILMLNAQETENRIELADSESRDSIHSLDSAVIAIADYIQQTNSVRIELDQVLPIYDFEEGPTSISSMQYVTPISRNFRIVKKVTTEQRYVDPDYANYEGLDTEYFLTTYYFYDKSSGIYLGHLYGNQSFHNKTEGEILAMLEENKTCICCCLIWNIDSDPHL